MDSVINSTVLSNFAAVKQLALLQAVTSCLYVPVEVYDEVIAGRLAGYAFYDDIERHIYPITPTGWLELTTMTAADLLVFVDLPNTLHRGEGACLSIARTRGWGFLSDDRAARTHATAWGIPISGTLGVLLLAIEDGLLTIASANQILQQMIKQARYHSPVNDLGLLIAK